MNRKIDLYQVKQRIEFQWWIFGIQNETSIEIQHAEPTDISCQVACTWPQTFECQTYLLFDSRYHDDPDRAICLTVSETLEEAKSDRKEMFSKH